MRRWLTYVFCLVAFIGALGACTPRQTSKDGDPPMPTAPKVDLTSAPFFSTPDKNITCGLPGYRWTDYSDVDPDHADDLLCRIAQHTVAPTSCEEEQYEAAPGVSMAPDQYASFTCLGREQDKLLLFVQGANELGEPREPYASRDGERVNLGPVECLVAQAQIDCSAKDHAGHHFHLDRQNFTSPLLDGDDVKMAENKGQPVTYASTGVVRPKSYSIGKSSFEHLRWSEWSNGSATGSGTFTYNTCDPDCASGNYETEENVGLSFQSPKIVCGQWFFTEFEVRDPISSTGEPATLMPEATSRGSDAPCLSPSVG